MTQQLAEEIELLRRAAQVHRRLARTNWREMYAAGLITRKEADYRARAELVTVDLGAAA